MATSGKDETPVVDPVAVVNTIMDYVAHDEADLLEFTPQEDRWATKVRDKVDAQLAALRRQLTPTAVTLKRPPSIPDEIRELDRDGLLVRLNILQQQPGVRFAHLDLEGLSTEDLRQMVAAILKPPQADDSER